MKILVLKFGGTSVGTIKKIKKVAEIIANYKKKNYKVIVVSSAMSGVTNELIKKSLEISDNFSNSEHDVLVSSGEQMACSLIAGRLIHKGFKRDVVLRVQELLYASEYKRYQSAPGTKISKRPFALGRRYPLVNQWRDKP